jgi:elongation factor 1-beta
MASFLPLDTPKALGMLNSHLGNESYINGVEATTDDTVVFNALGKEPEKKLAHVLRWYKHIVALQAAGKVFGAPTQVLAAAAPAAAAEKAPAAAPAAAAAEEDDDDVDLFGEETEEDKAANEARKAAAAAAAKAGPVGRSAVILDVKPWGEETDMALLEKNVRSIALDGLEWKAGQLLDVAFGVKKLQIMCHIVDDLVSVDEDIIAAIEAFEDLVQSVDTFAFNKL